MKDKRSVVGRIWPQKMFKSPPLEPVNRPPCTAKGTLQMRLSFFRWGKLCWIQVGPPNVMKNILRNGSGRQMRIVWWIHDHSRIGINDQRGREIGGFEHGGKRS